MRRAAVLLALSCAALADDFREAKFREFFDNEIRRQWQETSDSGLKTVLLRKLMTQDTAGAARWLLSEVVAKEEAADEVREAVKILSNFKSFEAVGAMVEFWGRQKKGTESRALSLSAFARRPADETRPPLLATFKEGDLRSLVAACDGVAAASRAEFAPQVALLLQHRSPAVRVAALRAIADLRAEEAMPQVFKLFAQDGSLRVRGEAWRALSRLSREDLPADPAAWKEWWTRESAADPAKWGAIFPSVRGGALRPAYFFRIPLITDRVCFVLDVSGRMEDAWAIDFDAERKKEPPERTPNFFSVKTRWQLVMAHLSECLKTLPDGVDVAVVCYSHDVKPYPEERMRFVKNGKQAREKLLAYVDGVERSGTTAMYEGLKTAWGFLKGGSVEANLEDGCDTIVFVTCGQPTEGELKDRPDRIRDEVWRASFLRRMTVHTVGLHNHAYDLLKSMARDSGGLYVHAQQAGDVAEPQDLDFWPAKKKAFEEARKQKKTG